jgi:hypothetical protein
VTAAGSGGSDLSDIHIPIVIGVTGHREIAHHPREILKPLENAVNQIFAEFRHRHPGKTPLRLLTSLAPGADQLVAEIAERSSAGVEIVAPLPFPPEVYAQSSTFQNYERWREKFLEWMERVPSFVVPYGNELTDPADTERWMEFANDRDRRHACYANVGAYIAGHCHALIAIWDEKESEKDSGTGEIVSCKLEGRLPRKYPYPKPLQMGGDEGPVYILHWPRDREEAARQTSTEFTAKVYVPCSSSADDGPCEVPEDERVRRSTRWRRLRRRFLAAIPFKALQPKPVIAEWRIFEEGCQAVQDFNEDVADPSRGAGESIQKRLARISRSSFAQEVGEIHYSLGRILKIREASAALAANLDSRSWWARLSLFGVLVFAAVSIHIRPETERLGFDFPGGGIFLLAVFVLFLLVGALIVFGGLYCRLYERRLDYRAFSEALRVRLMWAAAGIGESVADNYLGQMRGEVSWPRRALISLAPPPATWPDRFTSLPTPTAKLNRLRHVAHEWVNGQQKFYEKTARRHLYCGDFQARIGFVLAFLGFFEIVVTLGGYHELASSKSIPLSYSILGIATACVILLLGIYLFKIADSNYGPGVRFGLFGIIVGAFGILCIGIGMGVLISDWRLGLRHSPECFNNSEFATWETMSAAVLILAGGSFLAYREQASHKELANLYERMSTIFKKGYDELERLFNHANADSSVVVTEIDRIVVSPQGGAEVTRVIAESKHGDESNIQSIQGVFVALGREAITENAQWLILRRGQPLALRPP